MLNILSIHETTHFIKVFKFGRAVCISFQRWTFQTWPVERMKLASHEANLEGLFVYPTLLVYLALSGKNPMFIDFFLIFL